MSKTHPLAHEKALSPEQLRGYTAQGVAIPPDFVSYSTLDVELEILERLKDDALPIELSGGKTELIWIKSSPLVITRPNYSVPEDDELVAIPLIHSFAPEYGIATLQEYKKVAHAFIEMASSEEMKSIFHV